MSCSHIGTHGSEDNNVSLLVGLLSTLVPWEICDVIYLFIYLKGTVHINEHQYVSTFVNVSELANC